MSKVKVTVILASLSYTFQSKKRTFLDLLIGILSNYSSECEKITFARKVRSNKDNTTFNAGQFVCVLNIGERTKWLRSTSRELSPNSCPVINKEDHYILIFCAFLLIGRI